VSAHPELFYLQFPAALTILLYFQAAAQRSGLWLCASTSKHNPKLQHRLTPQNLSEATSSNQLQPAGPSINTRRWVGPYQLILFLLCKQTWTERKKPFCNKIRRWRSSQACCSTSKPSDGESEEKEDKNSKYYTLGMAALWIGLSGKSYMAMAVSLGELLLLLAAVAASG
jgi:hypothetical protein